MKKRGKHKITHTLDEIGNQQRKYISRWLAFSRARDPQISNLCRVVNSAVAFVSHSYKIMHEAHTLNQMIVFTAAQLK